MEPIISPWIIYLISIVWGIKEICLVLMILAFLMSVTWFFCADKDEFERKKFKNANIILVVSTIGFILIPDKQTMLTMLTLHYITPDNLALVQNNVVELIQKVTEALKGGNL